MKKIRQIIQNEDVQARLFVIGFIITFALLAIFFM